METNHLAKHTLQICHATLTQTLEAAVTVQEQSQKTLETLLDQSSVVPQEGKRAINDWLEVCRQQTTAMKNVIDEGFRPFNLYFEE